MFSHQTRHNVLLAGWLPVVDKSAAGGDKKSAAGQHRDFTLQSVGSPYVPSKLYSKSNLRYFYIGLDYYARAARARRPSVAARTKRRLGGRGRTCLGALPTQYAPTSRPSCRRNTIDMLCMRTGASMVSAETSRILAVCVAARPGSQRAAPPPGSPGVAW